MEGAGKAIPNLVFSSVAFASSEDIVFEEFAQQEPGEEESQNLAVGGEQRS